ncbi:putative clathrin assembly protein At5g35200 isoform X2 [Phoenix dactylifera]|uniref:Clathrin assembly protein At5g35200 isoform X2 n=1 Tax=Phoenix dactylifera TaxID=42345 RepID=A0A8B8J4R5_PHODC|nr:putative clathrin assembly protein At5g35200 isoform X2 [Phoenix dactylifera]
MHFQSLKIYSAINEGTLNLVDKFFEMPRHDAIRALEIYRKARHQAERLSEFYEICKALDVGRKKNFIKIERPPASFIAAMEEYVKGAPCTLPPNWNMVGSDREIPPKALLAIEHNKLKDDHEKSVPIPAPAPATPEPPAAEITEAQITDILDLDDFAQDAIKLEEKNILELAIIGDDNPLKVQILLILQVRLLDGSLHLLVLQVPIISERKLAGGLDKLTLDSLYDNAIARRTDPGGSYMGSDGDEFL